MRFVIVGFCALFLVQIVRLARRPSGPRASGLTPFQREMVETFQRRRRRAALLCLPSAGGFVATIGVASVLHGTGRWLLGLDFYGWVLAALGCFVFAVAAAFIVYRCPACGAVVSERPGGPDGGVRFPLDPEACPGCGAWLR